MNSQPSCPACGGTQFEQRAIMPSIGVQRCAECGLLLSTIVRANDGVGEFSRVVQSRYERGLLATRDRQSEEIIALTRRHAPEARRLLDVGCSFGRFLHRAQSAGFEVVGIEPDAIAAAHARTLLGDHTVMGGELSSDSFLPESADVVTTLDVLEHIPVDVLAQFVATIHSVLKPGGVWIVKIPSSEGPFFRIAHYLSLYTPRLLRGVLERLWQSRYEYPHTVYFNARSLKRFATGHRFVVERLTYMNEVPLGTILDRLRYDDSLSPWTAAAVAPGLLVVALVGRLFTRSDSMAMVARRA